MISFRFAPDLRKRIAGRFFARVRRELNKAFMEEAADRGLTQAELARKLGVDRSVVCRQLSGTANLTMRTLADYAWALDRDLDFSMPKRESAANNHRTSEIRAPATFSVTPIPPISARRPRNSVECQGYGQAMMAPAA
jgi:transcriptional regulator with XRE-family HTH domain